MRVCLVLVVVLAPFGAVGGAAWAQDRVVLKRGRSSGRMTVSGEVIDFTGEEIRIRSSAGDAVRTYPAAEVVAVETAQSESHDRALAALAAGRVDEAIDEFEAALRTESRAWVRREILAQLVSCALRRGDYPSAKARFLTLLKGDPQTRHFRRIPLAWTAEDVPPAARDEAHAWLGDSSEAAQLIGASLLVEDPSHQMAARTVLRALAASPDPRIQAYAQMQGWRLELAAENPGDSRIRHWEERIEELSPDLRAGPAYVLGRAYATRHDYELAAATLLWLPLVDDHDFRLSARACLEAGLALDKIGQHAEARGLFREVAERYGKTPSGAEARRMLKSASQPPEPVTKGTTH
jgi:tetratricopeptide (TPR) repeat protein